MSRFSLDQERCKFLILQEQLGVVGTSDTAFCRPWASEIALGQHCSTLYLDPDGRGQAMAAHMNTTPIVPDLLEMLDRHQEWQFELDAEDMSDRLPTLFDDRGR